MIGNNSCGATAQAYGKTADNVRRLEVLTYDGVRIWVGRPPTTEFAEIIAAGGRRAADLPASCATWPTYLAEIRTGYPGDPAAGVRLQPRFAAAGARLRPRRALVGSEGTLVTVLHAELELVPVPAPRRWWSWAIDDIVAAADAVPAVLEHEPGSWRAWTTR